MEPAESAAGARCGRWMLLGAGCVALAACAGKPAGYAPVPPPTPAHLSADDQSAKRDEVVEQLLAKMTLEEKLGQLNQLRGGRSERPSSLVDDAQKELVRQGKVGSYLHVAGAEFLHDLQKVAVEQSRLGIPLLFGLDVVHGYRTILPVPLASACSWDPAAEERAARIAAREATASGIHWTFAPMVDIVRDARWGRIVEGAGEDPYLGAVMARARVRGFQGADLSRADTLLSCPKHFVAYGAAEGGRDYDSAEVNARTLAEVYLPPFRAAIDAGALSIMSAFNDVAGIPMTAHRSLLTELLREGWGFEGLVLSDWNAIDELRRHGVAADRAQAGVLALRAGVDMDMTSGIYAEELAAQVESKRLPEYLVDEAVRRVLRVKYSLGLFDDPFRYGDSAPEKRDHLSAEHVSFARDFGARSIVLLKNEGEVLPLSRKLRHLAVVGPLGHDAAAMLGCWKALGRPEDAVTLVDGLREALPEAKVTYTQGCEVQSDATGGFAEAEAAAEAAEAVVLALGENAEMSGEARSRSSLRLPGAQLELAQRVLGKGKPTVVVLMGGRPLAIPWLAEHAPAIVEGWLLGVQAGLALAQVLFGDTNPGGKLVVTFPRRTGQVPLYYAHRSTGRPASEDLSQDTVRYHDLPITPLYPFGYGLSYTSFEYRDLSITPARAGHRDSIRISCVVANTGQRAGDEVVQLYVRDLVASIARPVKQLCGFERVSIEAGESVTVTFEVPVQMLGLYDEDLSYVVEPGRFEVQVGSSSADIRLRGSLEVAEEIRGESEPGTVFSRVSVARR